MDKSAIFVDAGYLLAAGGRLTCGTTSRAAFKCDYVGLTTKLASWVRAHNGGQLTCLRTYWYDGATNAVPTPDHEQIGGLPYVKVRLGRLIRGEQKGVDALIYRDLMTLARERAISCAYLLSGDEDLREGVVAAQDMGVQVVLLGIPASTTNQSAALIRESDEHVILPKEHWEEHFSPNAGNGNRDRGRPDSGCRSDRRSGIRNQVGEKRFQRRPRPTGRRPSQDPTRARCGAACGGRESGRIAARAARSQTRTSCSILG